MATLLVIVPDRISAIVEKGEYQPRYYNPGNLFDEVHILMTNDDRVDPADVQRTVGDARLYLHNLPEDREHFTRGIQCDDSLLRYQSAHLPTAQRHQHLLT